MTLLKHGRLVDTNPWQRVSDEQTLPLVSSRDTSALSLLVSLARFRMLHSHAINTVSGVFLSPDDDVRTLLPLLHHVQLIVVDFVEPLDTRGYDQARVLREEMHYPGELRASGPIQADQIPFLARAGFDAFALNERPDEQQLRQVLARSRSDWQPSYALAVAG